MDIFKNWHRRGREVSWHGLGMCGYWTTLEGGKFTDVELLTMSSQNLLTMGSQNLTLFEIKGYDWILHLRIGGVNDWQHFFHIEHYIAKLI